MRPTWTLVASASAPTMAWGSPMPDPIERFQGMLILCDEDGYHWESDDGVQRSDSCFATCELCRADIANYLDTVESAERSEPYADLSNAEADADTLRSAGMGTDEDYGGDGEDRL